MRIASNMNLHNLAERMGDRSKIDDADAMRDLLVARFDGQDTADVPEGEWFDMRERATAGAAA